MHRLHQERDRLVGKMGSLEHDIQVKEVNQTIHQPAVSKKNRRHRRAAQKRGHAHCRTHTHIHTGAHAQDEDVYEQNCAPR